MSSQRPNLPTRTSPRVCQPAPDLNQCLQLSSLPQITSPRVCRPAPWPQPVSATVQPAPNIKPQSAPASLRPQPVSVLVHPSSQSAPDSQPQGVPASRPQRVQPPAPVQPPLPPAARRPRPSPCLCWIARLCGLGPPSVETDLVLDEMDTDEEWAPTAAQTLDWLQAELATVTEKLAWVHQQVSLSQVGGA
ncbi:vegetative cell wall protein gp1-like [Portunus trituberculatus]|uniref:vegetative cell wall protein gp1-like n=1 Tax=Portunus trituberculatus TaxID=210409 RepID=UPI001E1CFBF7|nr:vegetative cell wall protein gp1-like [Portunus trituberculatus]